MDTLEDGWQTAMPSSHAKRLPRAQQEAIDRQTLEEWSRLEGSWSGLAKHITHKSPESRTIHSRLKIAHDDHILGHGGYGHVEKVTYTHKNRSITLARKYVKAKYGWPPSMLRKEPDIMEKLDHNHIVKLIGTYTMRPNDLYILIWPVATGNLAELLWDIDSLRKERSDAPGIPDVMSRLQALELTDLKGHHPGQTYLQQIMGCITDAVAYCHNAKIRHLDVKPSNILVTPGGCYLADFGESRDVKDNDCTMTYGGRGTAKYVGREVRNMDSTQLWSMREADCYGLGIVLLFIATVLYGGDLADLEHILADWKSDGDIRFQERLRQFQDSLSLTALATQQWAHHKAHTFGPKHIIDLTMQMLSPNPASRPSFNTITGELVELGGVDQIYHGPCCRKPTRLLTNRLDTKLKVVVDENEKLKAENARLSQRLEELERLDETYKLRLENETKPFKTKVDSLQRQLDIERTAREEFEAQIAQGQISPRGSGRRRGNSGSRMDRSLNGHAVLQKQRPPNQAQAPGRPQVQRLTHTPKSLPQQVASTYIVKSLSKPISQRPDAAPRVSSAPTPIPPARKSSSRLPVAVNPTTPIRSRSGTPNLSRDLSLTDSTQFSLSSSTFSRLSGVSRDTAESAAPSPRLDQDDGYTMRFGDSSPLLVEPTERDKRKVGSVWHNPGIGLGLGMVNDRERRGSIGAELDAASAVSSRDPTTASIQGSVLSSPSVQRADVVVGSPPALYKEKSWADVARKTTPVRILR